MTVSNAVKILIDSLLVWPNYKYKLLAMFGNLQSHKSFGRNTLLCWENFVNQGVCQQRWRQRLAQQLRRGRREQPSHQARQGSSSPDRGHHDDEEDGSSDDGDDNSVQVDQIMMMATMRLTTLTGLAGWNTGGCSRYSGITTWLAEATYVTCQWFCAFLIFVKHNQYPVK